MCMSMRCHGCSDGHQWCRVGHQWCSAMVKPRQDEFERERDGVRLLLDMSRHVLLTVPVMRTAKLVGCR